MQKRTRGEENKLIYLRGIRRGRRESCKDGLVAEMSCKEKFEGYHYYSLDESVVGRGHSLSLLRSCTDKHIYTTLLTFFGVTLYDSSIITSSLYYPLSSPLPLSLLYARIYTPITYVRIEWE